MAVSKITLPDNTTQDIHDARIAGVDSTPTASSTNVVTSGGVATAIGNIEQFYFVQGSSSQAGNGTKGTYLSTKWEGTITGVSAVYNGLKIAYRIATNTGVGTAGAVLSIDNGSHYYPVVIQKNTVVSSIYPVGATFLAVFNSTQTANAYLTSNTKTVVTGCWQIAEYDTNTNTYQREYVSSDDTEYAITARYNTSTGESYYAEYGRYSDGVTLNPSTDTITASKFKVSGGTSSQFLKADGSVDSNTYLTTETEPAFTASAAHGISSSDISNWNGKQSALTFDSSPTASSTNPVTSGGVYTALSSKVTGTGVDNIVTLTAAQYEALQTKSPTTTYIITDDVHIAESISNKVTTISSSSTNTQYPSAKLVYDQLALRPKYYLCTDEAEYTSITTKDPTTLYLIPETNNSN